MLTECVSVCPHLCVLVFDNILGHLEGAEVFVHVLDLSVLRGILATVQQLGDGIVIIVNDTALISILYVPWSKHTIHNILCQRNTDLHLVQIS